MKGFEFDKPDMIVADEYGTPVPGVSGSTDDIYAVQKGLALGPGRYKIIRPDMTLTVFGEPEPEPDPEPDPVPDPEPEPPTGDIPFGDVKALQTLGLLPVYRDVGKPVSVDRTIAWTGQGGERGEIGHLPEDHSAFVAGHTDLLPGILDVAKQVPPDSRDHAHHPNLYWLPFLMTGDVRYIRHMERGHSLHMQWRNRPLGGSFGNKVSGRELAWNLRDLFQLAWAESQGYTEQTIYISALEANRQDLADAIGNGRPENKTFHILRMNYVYWASYGFSCWMEAFLGMELCNGVRMGFSEWESIAKWHYEHLELRLANWGFKGADADHIFFEKYDDGEATDWASVYEFAAKQDWDSITPYSAAAMADPDYAALPFDELVFLGNSAAGRRYTYQNRTHGLHQWATMAVGIDDRAQATADALYHKISERGDIMDYRHAFAGEAK